MIDASAEPSVMANITSPVEQVYNNNLTGLVNFLELAKRLNAGFVFLSTSRVYPINNLETIDFVEHETRYSITGNQTFVGVTEKGIGENFPFVGSRSFYGTTKHASELMIEEYNTLEGLRTIVNRNRSLANG